MNQVVACLPAVASLRGDGDGDGDGVGDRWRTIFGGMQTWSDKFSCVLESYLLADEGLITSF